MLSSKNREHLVALITPAFTGSLATTDLFVLHVLLLENTIFAAFVKIVTGNVLISNRNSAQDIPNHPTHVIPKFS